MDKSNNLLEGKKTFFLYPHIPQGEQIIKNIIRNECEAYQINNHISAINLLDEFNNSLLFINVDSKLKHHDWALYMKSIIENPATDEIKIGAVTADENDQILQSHISELDIPCGCINIADKLEKCTDSIIKILEEQNARGRRKYLRAHCDNIHEASLSIKFDKEILQGHVHDISSAGMACIINDNIELQRDAYLDDILLNLKGNISKVAGKIAGVRKIESNDLYVIMFDYRKTYRERNKIHDFIYYTLQQQMLIKIKEIEKNQ